MSNQGNEGNNDVGYTSGMFANPFSKAVQLDNAIGAASEKWVKERREARLAQEAKNAPSPGPDQG